VSHAPIKFAQADAATGNSFAKDVMPMRDRHDLALVYGETMDTELPLILVVGREPNNPMPFNTQVGRHDFAAWRRADGKKRSVAFWDQSYGVIGRSAGTDVRGLKRLAKACNASAVAIADVMPVPAPYASGSDAPRRAREAADERAIAAHVERLLDLEDLMHRVRLVVLAGHRHGSFSPREKHNLHYASALMEARCGTADKPIPTVVTKSMHGMNQPYNLTQLRERPDALRVCREAVDAMHKLAAERWASAA